MSRMFIGPYMLRYMEQEMHVIRKNLKATEDMQDIYVDQYRVFKESQFRDHVCLRIKPKKNSLNIRSCAKLAPQYYGPLRPLRGLD